MPAPAFLRMASATGEAAPAATTHKSPAGAWANRPCKRAATPRAARDCCNWATAQLEGAAPATGSSGFTTRETSRLAPFVPRLRAAAEPAPTRKFRRVKPEESMT